MSAADAADRYRIERWGRYWAVMDADMLVAVVVYLKGARELVRRLAGE